MAGFTVFKTSMTLMLVGAVWGLLTSTRLLRGEEDAGRWELLLAGRTTRRGAVLQALGGLGAGAFVLWAVTAIITVIAGSSSKVHIGARAGMFFALALVSSSVMFLAVGAVTSQLAATRRQAAAYAAVCLGLSFGVRMVADSGIGLQWLAWLSPLGWVERLQPLTSPRPVALLPIAALSGVLAFVGVQLAGARDVGTSTLPDRARAAPHVRLLASPAGFTVRLARPSVIGWTVAVAASGLLTGVVANAAGTTMSGSSVQEVFSRLGAQATGLAAFLGVSFLILAVLVAFAAASQVTSARVEADGHLDHLLAQPVSRSSWLGGRLLVAVVALVFLGVVAGIATWVGTVTQGSGLRFSSAVGAGLNIVPPAMLLLGAGTLAIGAWPRRASLIVYGLLAWSLLVDGRRLHGREPLAARHVRVSPDGGGARGLAAMGRERGHDRRRSRRHARRGPSVRSA